MAVRPVPWATIAYVLGSAGIFFAFGPRSGPTVSDAPRWWWDLFAYRAHDLVDAPLLTILHFATSVWANVHWLQAIYVLALLVLFGVWFERMEGSRRAVALFYGSSIAAGLVAGALLLILEAWIGGAFWEREAARVWVGGSAGCYGLMGGLAARARQPLPWLMLFVVWEIGLAVVYLHRATPLFHVTALTVGFLVVRRWPPASILKDAA